METTTIFAGQRDAIQSKAPPAIGTTKNKKRTAADAPRPDLFLTVIVLWLGAVLWFQPRLFKLLDIVEGPLATGALLFFIVFVELAWLYGFYNISVILFASIYRWTRQKEATVALPLPEPAPAVALLYTTCNDFVADSAESCVRQDYPNYTVYLLDDSSEPACRKQVDAFAEKYPERVRVIRRPDRRGFKAGNLNHALGGAASKEPYFALADADEILPPDFLSRLCPRLEADPSCGFIQANHRANPKASSRLAKAMGSGIDIHWRWYQPLRNRFGFVMLLGHGAVLRRRCWEAVGGFPELVSEDLAYAIRIREQGWKGRFAEDVVCYEDFPDTIAAFRVRFMKWTRGTCELLSHEMMPLIRSRKISVVEKLDILFPTLNLPLSLFYFLFIIDANLILPLLTGTPRPLTLSFAGSEFVVPMWGLDPGYSIVFSADFFLITLMALLAPILCFVIDLIRRPLLLFRFLCRSTAVYSALGPLSSLGVLSYALTGKATFLVTGDRSASIEGQELAAKPSFGQKFRMGVRTFFLQSHPNQSAVQSFEILCGVLFGTAAILLANISFFGLALAFILHPMMHRFSWDHPVMRPLVYLPFIFMIGGMALSGLGLLGFQTVFFGFGFHF